jgi:glucose dehydrogenase
MTKVFYGSYVICALLGLLFLFMFVEAYLRGEIGIYHPVVIFTSGETSMFLLASIFFPLRAKLVALLLFALCTISTYIWEMSRWPIDLTGMSFFNLLFQGGLFLIFAFVPLLGMVSGVSPLRRHPAHKRHNEEASS